MGSVGPRAEAARGEVRGIIAAKGHATENARRVVERLAIAFEAGDLVRTRPIDDALRDLETVLRQDEGQRPGGKSGEAARFILRAIDRMLDGA